MTEIEIVGEAVLRDYPLRLWAQQQEHTEAMLREFNLLLIGQESGDVDHAAPRELISVAETFTAAYGALIDRIAEERYAALERGLDRIDSRVPLPANLPALIEQVTTVLDAADRYCTAGDMLTLARPPELVVLYDWTVREILAQLEGAEPTPWPGPW